MRLRKQGLRLTRHGRRLSMSITSSRLQSLNSRRFEFIWCRDVRAEALISWWGAFGISACCQKGLFLISISLRYRQLFLRRLIYCWCWLRVLILFIIVASPRLYLPLSSASPILPLCMAFAADEYCISHRAIYTYAGFHTAVAKCYRKREIVRFIYDLISSIFAHFAEQEYF